jgi:hypothetical protein
MPVFIDNDAIQKLAEMDLLPNAMSVVGASSKDVYVLGTARFKFNIKNPRKGRERYGAEVYQRIHDFIAASQTTPVFAGQDYDTLSAIAGIDAGEAILYAAAANTAASILITGDKTSIRALTTSSGCASITARLKGKIVCFEQIVERVINTSGFDYVLRRISASATISDSALKLCFSRGEDSTESEARAGLSSFIDNLRHGANGVLAP